MSTYSEISKKVGWQRRDCAPISTTEAKQLYKEVSNGSTEAFERVFTLHRFMVLVGITRDQTIAFNIVEAAFEIGKGIHS